MLFIGSIIGLAFVLLLLVQLPSVQTWIARQLTHYLEDEWETRVSLGRISIKFIETATLQDLYLEDQQGDTLLFLAYAKVDIGLFSLRPSSVEIDEIRLEDAYINLYRQKDSASFNYQFILDKVTQTETAEDTTSESFGFDMAAIGLKNIRMRMKDDTTDLAVVLPEAEVTFETLGLSDSHIKIDAITLDSLFVSYKAPPSEVATDTTESSPPIPLDSAWINPSGFRYSIQSIALNGCTFIYQLTDSLPTPGQLDYNNIALQETNLAIQDFYLGPDTLRVSLEKLSFAEANSGFSINKTKASATLEGTQLRFILDAFETPNSTIPETVQLHGIDIDPTKEVSEVLAAMEANISLQQATLGLKDIAYFLPGLDSLAYLVSLQPTFSLDVQIHNNTLLANSFSVIIADQLKLEGRATALQLSNPKQLKLELEVNEFASSLAFFQRLTQADSLPFPQQYALPFRLQAQLKGNSRNARLTARLNTLSGRIDTQLNYSSPLPDQLSLAGAFSVSQLDPTPVLPDSLELGRINLNSSFRLEKQGEHIKATNFSLTVDSLLLNDYMYKGLSLEGSFIDSTLDAKLNYNDPLLSFDFASQVSLRDSLPEITVSGQVARADLFRLNLLEDTLALATEVTADFKGNTADNLQGRLMLLNTNLIRLSEVYSMDSMLFSMTQPTPEQRKISLITDFAEANLSGNFQFAQLPAALDQTLNHYRKHESLSAIAGSVPEQQLNFEFSLTKEPSIAKAFASSLVLDLPLSFTADYNSVAHTLDLNFIAPGIAYADMEVKNFQATANTGSKGLAYAFSTAAIRVNENIDLPSAGLKGDWTNGLLGFDLNLATPADTSYLNLVGTLKLADTLALQISGSELQLLGREIKLSQQARIEYAPDYILIKDLDLTWDEQAFRVATSEEASANPLLSLNMQEFQIGEFLNLFGFQEYGIHGSLNGNLSIHNPFALQAIESTLQLNQLIIDSIAIGDLQADLKNVSDQNHLTTNISLKGPGNDLTLLGNFSLADSSSAIDLQLTVDAFNLGPWDVFASEYIEQLHGVLQGRLSLQGSLNQPVAKGEFSLTDDPRFKLNMTGAGYRVKESAITLEPGSLIFQNITLLDSLNHPLQLTGTINHTAFSNFVLDLQMDATDFQLVDKPYTLKELFYGKLALNMTTAIEGPLDNLEVSGTLKASEHTDFTMVMLDTDAAVSNEEYINFIDKSALASLDSLNVNYADSLHHSMNYMGISLKGKLEIPPEAIFRVVVDPATGDYLEVQGKAEDIRVNMSPVLGIDLQGEYEIVEGHYRLTFMELIEKNFVVQEGSRISFRGNPFFADLNLTAIYTAIVSRYPLIQDLGVSSGEAAAAKRKEPVNVLMGMRGTLEEPAFLFDIAIPESVSGTGVSSSVTQQLAMIKADESKLFKQVFGLVVLNRFIPAEPTLNAGRLASDAANTQINQSLSDFFTNQLSAVTEDYLGVEMEVELADQQDAAGANQRDVNVSFGRSFFDDAVEVKVGGTTGMGGGTAGSGGGSGNFAGNFEILYHISPAGNLNLKIFQRNERDYMTNELYPRSGIATSYSKSFDTLYEFVGGRDSRKNQMLKSDGIIPAGN